MADTGVSIVVNLDAAPLARLFARLAAAGADLSPAMRDIAGQLEKETQYRFSESSRGPSGQAWKPSARALKTGGKTLRDTGRLLNSITSESDATSARVGTNVDYAAIHQFGGKIKKAARIQTLYVSRVRAENGDWRFVKSGRATFKYDVNVGEHDINMPARPFIGLSQGDNMMIADILMDHLRRAAGAP